MRILILGGSGMLGHRLWLYLPARFPDIYTTLHKDRNKYDKYNLFNNKKKVIDNIDAVDFSVVERVLDKIRPDVILNCIGITKRRDEINNMALCINLNSLFPHNLANWGEINKAKIITFSTDCIFDGKTGNYIEENLPSASDIYGKTKALGELRGTNTLTLRSSFIGPELFQGSELLEWFLAQTGPVKGFKNAIYSGLTTFELCRVVEKILVSYPQASGLYNVSSDPITKFDLLMLIKKEMDLSVEIVPDETFCCDRSLDSSRFRKEFNYIPPSWEVMVQELSAEFKRRD